MIFIDDSVPVSQVSKKKRQDFKELTEEEVESMQEAIREVIAAHAQDTSEETHGM